MKNYLCLLLVFLLIFSVRTLRAQAEPVSKTMQPTQAARLNETLIRRSLTDYSFPPELDAAAESCREDGPEECFFRYKTFENSENAAVRAAANTELAFLSMQAGRGKEAVKYAQAALSAAPSAPFVNLSAGWTYLSAGEYKKARESFKNLSFLTSDFEFTSAARLGDAIAAFYLKDKKAAMDNFFYVYTSYPYMISFAAEMLGRVTYAFGGKTKLHAVTTFSEQALKHDARNLPALKLQAESYQKAKDYLRAWQTYAMLLSTDPGDAVAEKRLNSLTKKTKTGKSVLPSNKMDLPLVAEYTPSPSRSVKIALYADAAAKPAGLREFEIVSFGRTKIISGGVERYTIDANAGRKLVFEPEAGGVLLRDAWGNADFASGSEFIIQPEEGKTILIKNVRAASVHRTDLGDKEIKGSIIVAPSEEGMVLVNKVPVEDVIGALMYGAAQNLEGPETLAALVIAGRSYLYELIKNPRALEYDITDNEPNIKFDGVNMGSSRLQDAVRATGNMVIAGMSGDFYQNCGPLTESNVQNTQNRLRWTFSPANVFKYMLSNPTETLLSAPQDDTLWSPIKWIYKYDAKDIERRANAIKEIGKIKAVFPSKQTAYGRTLELTVEGKKDTLVLSGRQIADVLGAGTTRSDYFALIPLYKGKKLREVILFGSDTGSGRGLCAAGAAGLEQKGNRQGVIINYYFPFSRVTYAPLPTANESY